MRKYNNLAENWFFTKEKIDVSKIKAGMVLSGEKVVIPHTWNAVDGQDGGNDYYRGTCFYARELEMPNWDKGNEEVWLEFAGVAMRAKVYLNGALLGSHDGGYSTFRVNLSEYLQEKNVLVVSVDNSENQEVYPQKADFTFYGGIYREVRLITVQKTHFSLGYYGGCGVKVTPQIEDECARVTVESWVQNAKKSTKIVFTICEADGSVVTEEAVEVSENKAEAMLVIPKVHLWNGICDPYQYAVKACMVEEQRLIDEVEVKFGCRSYLVDPERGFFLNGKSYPLCGAARHQDRQGVGNALTSKMQEEDMALMLEMGANTIRLAHYQHDQYFYDLADQYGLIVWAEIPYISQHMPQAKENTISQMTELIIQNYNHPSIVCWGLSNEITIAGGVSKNLVENHRILNDLCHKLDATRLTTMANVFLLGTDEELVKLPDIRSYNLYNGWYVGNVEDNDVWFDEFHAKYPDTVIGLSEYGADANPQYQSANPVKGDYTEGYQALYHEHMLEMWSTRPFIWAMHVWNMFDFGADGRSEGGKEGQNQKGLVTFDRKLKKDAFYIYKAYLSKEPFVHICGRRYVDRVEDKTMIKVYSNQPEVTLLMDGKQVEKQSGNKIFCFEVPIQDTHRITAVSETCKDEITIHKVSEANPEYLCPGVKVNNWFEEEPIEIREGYFSIKDTLGAIKSCPASAALYQQMMDKALASFGDVAKNVQLPEEVLKKMDATSLEDNLKMAGHAFTPEAKKQLNAALSQIKKPE